jgi:hypothetical protein
VKKVAELSNQGIRLYPFEVHGGVTEQQIADFMLQTLEQLRISSRAAPRIAVIFFDELNTSAACGLIKEIMCDRRCRGMPLVKPEDRFQLAFIGACNPYRQRSGQMATKVSVRILNLHFSDVFLVSWWNWRLIRV